MKYTKHVSLLDGMFVCFVLQSCVPLLWLLLLFGKMHLNNALKMNLTFIPLSCCLLSIDVFWKTKFLDQNLLAFREQYMHKMFLNISKIFGLRKKTKIYDSIMPPMLIHGNRFMVHCQSNCHHLIKEQLWHPKFFTTQYIYICHSYLSSSVLSSF